MLQARDDHMAQMNVAPIYFYNIGKTEAPINWSMVIFKGSTRDWNCLETTGPVPADSRH